MRLAYWDTEILLLDAEPVDCRLTDDGHRVLATLPKLSSGSTTYQVDSPIRRFVVQVAGPDCPLAADRTSQRVYREAQPADFGK